MTWWWIGNVVLLLVVVPVLAFALFLATWGALSQTIVTKYGTLPTPAQVWHEAGALLDHHYRSREAASAFYEEQARTATELRNAASTSSLEAALVSSTTQ